MSNAYTVTFQPSGRRGPATAGQDLLTIARSLGVDIESACGGKGACGKCRVRLEPPAGPEGADPACDSALPPPVSAPTKAETRLLGPVALAAGMRLACQAQVLGDLVVFVPEESRRAAQIVRKEAGKGTVPVEPAVKRYRLLLRRPTLEDALPDAERVLAALEAEHGLTGLSFDFAVLRQLPGLLRDGKLGRGGRRLAGRLLGWDHPGRETRY